MGKQLLIADAGTKELAAFARDSLGMNLPGNMLRENMLARIGAAWDKDYIVLPDYLSGEPQHMDGQVPKPATAEQATGPSGPGPSWPKAASAGATQRSTVSTNSAASPSPQTWTSRWPMRETLSPFSKATS